MLSHVGPTGVNYCTEGLNKRVLYKLCSSYSLLTCYMVSDVKETLILIVNRSELCGL